MNKKVKIEDAQLEVERQVYLRRDFDDVLSGHSKVLKVHKIIGHAIVNNKLYYIIYKYEKECLLYTFDDFILPKDAEKEFKEAQKDEFDDIFNRSFWWKKIFLLDFTEKDLKEL